MFLQLIDQVRIMDLLLLLIVLLLVFSVAGGVALNPLFFLVLILVVFLFAFRGWGGRRW